MQDGVVFTLILFGGFLLVLVMTFLVLEAFFKLKIERYRMRLSLLRKEQQIQHDKLWKEQVFSQRNSVPINKETNRILHEAYQQIQNKKNNFPPRKD